MRYWRCLKMTMPRPMKSRLGLRDVDLDAVRSLRSRVLAERSRSLCGHQPPPRFLPLPVRQVQRLLPCHTLT
ncbi:hypothetical protein MHYP_G00141250 [Metynnis hypsauchen]